LEHEREESLERRIDVVNFLNFLDFLDCVLQLRTHLQKKKPSSVGDAVDIHQCPSCAKTLMKGILKLHGLHAK
jgi:hypothetical protein